MTLMAENMTAGRQAWCREEAESVYLTHKERERERERESFTLWNNPLVHCKDLSLNWFNKTLIGQQPDREYRQGNQTKDDEKEKSGIRNFWQIKREQEMKVPC